MNKFCFNKLKEGRGSGGRRGKRRKGSKWCRRRRGTGVDNQTVGHQREKVSRRNKEEKLKKNSILKFNELSFTESVRLSLSELGRIFVNEIL